MGDYAKLDTDTIPRVSRLATGRCFSGLRRRAGALFLSVVIVGGNSQAEEGAVIDLIAKASSTPFAENVLEGEIPKQEQLVSFRSSIQWKIGIKQGGSQPFNRFTLIDNTLTPVPQVSIGRNGGQPLQISDTASISD